MTKLMVSVVFVDPNQPRVHQDCTPETLGATFDGLVRQYASINHLIITSPEGKDYYTPQGQFLFGIKRHAQVSQH